MIPMPNNLILFVCVAIVGSIIAFIIYGLIRGFENVLKESENPECLLDYCEIERQNTKSRDPRGSEKR
jgi:hypothetical protein